MFFRAPLFAVDAAVGAGNEREKLTVVFPDLTCCAHREFRVTRPWTFAGPEFPDWASESLLNDCSGDQSLYYPFNQGLPAGDDYFTYVESAKS